MSWHIKQLQWTANIGVNGRLIHLGSYNDLHEARAAYAEACVKYFGEFGRAA